MDDGEENLSNRIFLSNTDIPIELEEFLRENTTSTCTHTHICNPPGPNMVEHTHTCYHSHSQDVSGEEEEPRKFRKPLGNRVAVRKYREKKKAHTVYLEEEVKKLRQVNHELQQRLQGQEALEAEVVGLRTILLGLHGKIDSELGSFPKQWSDDGLSCFGSDGLCTGEKLGISVMEGSCEQPMFVECRIDGEDDMEVKASGSVDVVGSFMLSAT